MAANILFQMSGDEGESLQSQLRRAVLDAILSGSLSSNFKLPSSRQLSKDMKLSRNTVLIVYRDLVDDGYLVIQKRSGHYVNEDFVNELNQSRFKPSQTIALKDDKKKTRDWSEKLNIKPSSLNYLDLPKDWRKLPYPFVYGQPDTKLFPLSAWRECSRLALGINESNDWIHDDKIYDDPLLVEQIKTRLLPARGIYVSEENILITLGAQNALYMLASLLVQSKTRVAIEHPGYPDIHNIMSLHTNNLAAIPVDKDGMFVDERLDDCDYVYVTPSHQCPTTVTMPLSRRQELLARAQEKDFTIIEDDYENEVNYSKSASPALKALDQNDRVIYISSLSKILFPGLRVGYLVADAELVSELKYYRRLVVRYTPSNNQRTLALFLSLGHYDSLLFSLRKSWSQRWNAVRNALETYMPDCAFPKTTGGSSYWVILPEGESSSALVQAAKEKGILIESGHPFCHNYLVADRCFRIGFTSIDVSLIHSGIKLLGEIYDELRIKKAKNKPFPGKTSGR